VDKLIVIRKFFLSVVLAGFSPFINAQILSDIGTSTTSKYADSVNIYVFCADVNPTGTLTAIDSTGRGGYEFVWSQYNTETNTYDISLSEFTVNNDSTLSTVPGLSDGGYKVELTKGDTTQIYFAWVYINDDLSTEMSVIDPLDCKLLELNAIPDFTTNYTYYNPVNGQAYQLENGKGSYNWDSDPESQINNYDYTYTSTNNLPLEDTRFIFTVTDKFGCEADAEVEYTAIATKADYSFEIFNRDDEIFEPKDSANGSAPLIMNFINESVNGYEYFWDFGDSLIKDDIDTLSTTDLNMVPEHTYYYTNTYSAKLISTSSYGCVDSLIKEVVVDPSELDIPNVFSPNHDGQGDDIFILKDESIRDIKISIYSRSGRRVHDFEGDINNWEGWDGKVRGRDEAAAGVYYYVIEARGWDDVKYREKGFVYLFR